VSSGSEAHMPMSARHFRQIPILLTGMRGLLGPFVIACAYLRPDPMLLVSCVVVAFLSDVFDGINHIWSSKAWGVALCVAFVRASG